MRETSSNYSTQYSQQLKENRGGEKKVMKKSLSLILAIAMVFSMFASVAFADTTMTTQQKYDALETAGIFNGIPGQGAALDAPMTRGAVAKVLALTFGLTVDDNATASYSDDVNHWAKKYIEAVTAAGYMKGTGAGKFSPDANFTTEQLAIVFVRALNLTVDPNAAVSGNVDSWAKGEVAAAVAAGLIPASTDYTVDGNRSLLVGADYTAYKTVNTPAALTVSKGEATGAKQITVTFNKAVDNTSAATFTVKNGNQLVYVTPTWSDDKMSVKLASSVALGAGDYTVTVGGLGIASGDDVASLSVAPETIANVNIDANAYVTAVSGLTETVTVGYTLLNQYGEDVTANYATSDFNVYSTQGGASVTSNNPGTITLSSVSTDQTSAVVTLISKSVAASGKQTVTINAQKMISSLTISAPTVKDGDTQLLATSGNNTGYVLPYTAKDQYGNDVTLTSADLSKLTFISSNTDAFDPSATGAVTVDSDGQLLINFKLFNGTKDVNLTVYVNATSQNSHTSFSVYGTATAATPILVAPTTRMANNDSAFQVELQMKDVFGNAMSADDIVAAASGLTITSGNSAVFTINATKVVKSGDSAYVQIDGSSTNGTALLTVAVNSTGNSSHLQITTVDPKYPAVMTLSTDVTSAVYDTNTPANSGTITLTATFKDQYGEDFTDSGSGVVVNLSSDNASAFTALGASTTVGALINGVTVTANAAGQTDVITADLQNGGSTVDEKTATLKTVASDAVLTYTASPASVTAATYAAGNLASPYATELTIVGKDASGNTVSLPSNTIQSVNNGNSTAIAVTSGSTGPFYVAGNGTDDATAYANVTFKKIDGTVGVIAVPVTVKSAAPVAQSIVAHDKDDNTVTSNTVSGNYDFFDTTNALHFVVTDQYGTTAMSSTSNVAIFVTTPSGAVVQATGGMYDFTSAAAGDYTVTAVIGSLSTTVTVTK